MRKILHVRNLEKSRRIAFLERRVEALEAENKQLKRDLAASQEYNRHLRNIYRK